MQRASFTDLPHPRTARKEFLPVTGSLGQSPVIERACANSGTVDAQHTSLVDPLVFCQAIASKGGTAFDTKIRPSKIRGKRDAMNHTLILHPPDLRHPSLRQIFGDPMRIVYVASAACGCPTGNSVTFPWRAGSITFVSNRNV